MLSLFTGCSSLVVDVVVVIVALVATFAAAPLSHWFCYYSNTEWEILGDDVICEGGV